MNPTSPVSNSTIEERDFEHENNQLAIQIGNISEAEVIIRDWERAENLIRSTITSLNDNLDSTSDYSSQIEILSGQGKKLRQLFDRIGQIILNEPTYCGIKQSKISSWITSSIGAFSGMAGLGTILYDYINSSAPNLAPVILTTGGLAIAGFQSIAWGYLKKEDEERTKLLLLRSRSGIINEAWKIKAVLKKIDKMRAQNLNHPTGSPKLRRTISNVSSDPSRAKDLWGRLKSSIRHISNGPKAPIESPLETAPPRTRVRFRQPSPARELEMDPLKCRKHTTRELLNATQLPSLQSESYSISAETSQVVVHHRVRDTAAGAAHDTSSDKSSEDAVDIFHDDREIPMDQVHSNV